MRESDEEAALLGRIAVRHGFITMEQLANATLERGRVGKKLGAIMLQNKMLTELQLAKVLALQKRHREAVAKKHASVRPKARKRIPTPKDWVAAEPVADHRPTPMRRRQRRTADVVQEKLQRAADEPPPRGTPVGRFGSPKTTRDRAAAEARSEVPTDPPKARRSDELQDSPELEINADTEREPAQKHDTPLEFELDLGDPNVEPRVEPRAEPRVDRKRDTPSGRSASTEPSMKAVRERAAAAEKARVEVVSARAATEHPESSEAPPSSTHVAAEEEQELTIEPLPWAPPPPTPAVAFLHKILEHASSSKASDVHVHAGVLAKMRQFGRLVPVTDEPIAADATEELLRAILTPWQQKNLDRLGETDLAYSVPGVGRFRANIYRQQNGYNGVFHVVPPAPPSLDALQLPNSLAKLTNYSQGLILLTGPGGCGKTSTLAALIDIINTERSDHILTIEDPVEYVHRSKRCIVNQRQVGRHTASFARGLRGALREDPDIICIGELRDLETISLALSAAETGHLVLATLHTGSAIGTINRIVGAYPPAQQPQIRAMMSESLRAVTSQRLIRTTDDNAVVPALEVLYVTKAVGALIRDNKTFQIRSVMQTGRAHGMLLLDESIKELFKAGRISREAALANCEDKRLLET